MKITSTKPKHVVHNLLIIHVLHVILKSAVNDYLSMYKHV